MRRTRAGSLTGNMLRSTRSHSSRAAVRQAGSWSSARRVSSSGALGMRCQPSVWVMNSIELAQLMRKSTVRGESWGQMRAPSAFRRRTSST